MDSCPVRREELPCLLHDPGQSLPCAGVCEPLLGRAGGQSVAGCSCQESHGAFECTKAFLCSGYKSWKAGLFLSSSPTTVPNPVRPAIRQICS